MPSSTFRLLLCSCFSVITGPMVVSMFYGSPIQKALVFSTSFRTNSLSMDSSTSILVSAMQVCPEAMNAAKAGAVHDRIQVPVELFLVPRVATWRPKYHHWTRPPQLQCRLAQVPPRRRPDRPPRPPRSPREVDLDDPIIPGECLVPCLGPTQYDGKHPRGGDTPAPSRTESRVRTRSIRWRHCRRLAYEGIPRRERRGQFLHGDD
uniref:Uncharacterized protein n=1 Tax=Odontella aurita TaxID=265563 RepID=A0A7S4N9G1_9STRA|mmetsp:Transcript_53629/g.160552  ORF Transcript_53629/g.160552 Transcript_53629/m.160552 type:complete len:206 (+) Transcript_53629:795-1412(+)